MSPESYSRSHSVGRFSSRCFVYPFPLKYFPPLFPSILAAVQINQFVLVTDFLSPVDKELRGIRWAFGGDFSDACFVEQPIAVVQKDAGRLYR